MTESIVHSIVEITQSGISLADFLPDRGRVVLPEVSY